MPKSLFQARRDAALLNQELLQELRDSEHVEEELTSATAAGDTRKLRGLPCYAKGASGVLTDSFVPGSDEHLEMMEGVG